MASYSTRKTGKSKRSKSKVNKKLSKHVRAFVKEMETDINHMKATNGDLDGIKKTFMDLEFRYHQLRLDQQSLMNDKT